MRAESFAGSASAIHPAGADGGRRVDAGSCRRRLERRWFGSLAGALLAPDALRQEIREVRRRTDAPFAVNLFAPLPREEPQPAAVARVRDVLAPWYAELG